VSLVLTFVLLVLGGCSKHHVQGELTRGWELPPARHTTATQPQVVPPPVYVYPPLAPLPYDPWLYEDRRRGIIIGPNNETWLDMGGGIIVGPGRNNTILDMRR
jgi:hypothetical protein